MRTTMMKAVLGGCMALMLAACAKPAPPAAATVTTTPPQAHADTHEGSHRHARRAKADRNGRGHRRHHEQKTPEQVIERFDTNKDGVLQKAEVPERKQAWFERVDQNHDGVVTKDEIVAFRAANKAKHEQAKHEHEKK
jgi:hypothetical protein